MPSELASRFFAGDLPKGDAAAVARVAGIAGAKKTSDLIPLCHPIPLTGVEVVLEPAVHGIRIIASVSTTGRTGVEMEAMTAVSTTALTVYDMVKGVARDVTIESIRLLTKSGGRSGDGRDKRSLNKCGPRYYARRWTECLRRHGNKCHSRLAGNRRRLGCLLDPGVIGDRKTAAMNSTEEFDRWTYSMNYVQHHTASDLASSSRARLQQRRRRILLSLIVLAVASFAAAGSLVRSRGC